MTPVLIALSEDQKLVALGVLAILLLSAGYLVGRHL